MGFENRWVGAAGQRGGDEKVYFRSSPTNPFPHEGPAHTGGLEDEAH